MKRSIGIDINKDKISIVQLSYSGERYSLDRASVREIPRRSLIEEEPTEEIRSLISRMMSEDGFDKSAKITVTAPAEKVFFHSFRTDLSVNGDIQRLIRFELEDDFPIPFDELVAGICGGRELKGDEREYLIGAINRMELRDRIQIMKEAHLKCSKVTTDVCALNAAASLSNNYVEDSAGVIIRADNFGTTMAVSDKGMLVCVRHFNYQDLAEADMSLTTIQVLTREIEMTLRAIFGSHTNTKLSFMVSANSELFDDLSARLSEAMDCEIAALDPFEEIAGAKQNGLNADSVVAAGLALVGADRVPGALDFLAVDEPGSDRTVEIRRGLFIAATLVLLIGASLLFRLFYQLHNLEKQHELVKKEIREVFVQTLPEETKIVNEAAQMNEKFNAIQAEYDALAAGFSNRVMPLKILQVISEKIPADQDIRINDMSMSPGSVRLTGIAPSFASMDNLITAFRRVSAFKSIEVLNTDVDARSNGVRFTFSILLK